MTPEVKNQLMKLTMAAKAVIYEPTRLQELLRLLATKEGAVTAAKTVVGAVESRMAVPPKLAAMLAVNAYMLLVDVAQEVTKKKPSPQVIKEVIGMIVSDLMGQAKAPAAPGAPAAQANGLLAMGGR